MIQVALAAALILYAVLVGVLLRECAFLYPLRWLLWEQYGELAVWLSLVLVLNLFLASYTVLRKLTLKETGDKLSHVEKQLRGSATILEELSERIRQRR